LAPIKNHIFNVHFTTVLINDEIAIASFVGGVEVSRAPIPSLISGISEAFVIFAILCFVGVFLLLVGVTKDKSKDQGNA
jgi:hypothetical protein